MYGQPGHRTRAQKREALLKIHTNPKTASLTTTDKATLAGLSRTRAIHILKELDAIVGRRETWGVGA